MGDLPEPYDEAIFFEDENKYACLANFPKNRGHSVIVWKQDLDDLHLLSNEEYLELMELVEKVRDAMLEVLDTDKVYLMYFDEAEHVHWHLVPRYVDEGVEVLEHDPDELEDFSLAKSFRAEVE